MPSSCYEKPLSTHLLPRHEMERPTVTIGDRTIGDGHPAYIIAEAGVNHDGCLARALKLVDTAARAGADAVKFQVFHAAELTTPTAAPVAYQQAAGARSQREMLARLELSDEALLAIRTRCRQRSIEFLATPFGIGDVERLARLDVRAIKIASTDLNNVPLLRAAAATGLPLIVSTGAATPEEIDAAVDALGDWDAGDRLILLHCVSRYPTPLEAANLRAIRALQATFAVPCGFSDHTTSTQTGAWAVAAGACVLEKHFTLDKTAPGPDHAMSLSPRQLRAYVRAVRKIESVLGSGALGLTDLETEVRTLARRSLVAAAPIPAGTMLTPALLALKRPGHGIGPDQLDQLVGRRATRDIPPDTVLTWDMLA